MSLSSADESVLQVIVKNLLLLRHHIPEFALVIDGKKSKGNGCFFFRHFCFERNRRKLHMFRIKIYFISQMFKFLWIINASEIQIV
jgi:hypothetical protein